MPKKKILMIGFGLALLATTTFLYLSSRHSVLAQEAYNIVFLTTPENVSSNLFQQLQTSAPNIRTVQNFEEVRSANVDALVVDSAAISLVDNTWAQDAYRRGVVIAGINISGQDLRSLVGGICRVETSQFTTNYYVVVSRLLLADNPADIPLLEASERITCDGSAAQGVTGVALFTTASVASLLSTMDDYTSLDVTVKAQVDNIRESDQAFNSAERSSGGN